MLIFGKTANLRAVQLLLGHTKVDSKVRDLGVELDDALSIAEKIDIWAFGGWQRSSAIPDQALLISGRTGCSEPLTKFVDVFLCRAATSPTLCEFPTTGLNAQYVESRQTFPIHDPPMSQIAT